MAKRFSKTRNYYGKRKDDYERLILEWYELPLNFDSAFRKMYCFVLVIGAYITSFFIVHRAVSQALKSRNSLVLHFCDCFTVNLHRL